MINDLSEFKRTSDIIVANRMATELNDVKLRFTQEIYLTLIGVGP